jgi:short-subunit dehydrogenase
MAVCAVVGVGPGVGMAVARRFAREGFQLALIARRAEAVQAAAAEIGGGARGIAADAGDPASLHDALAQAGAVEVLVYNAVAARPAKPSQLDPAALAAEFAVNVTGALVAAQAVLPGMRAAGRGTILLTGGGFAFEPMPVMASLGVGKAGLRNLAFSLAKELEPEGIHVATVTIGGIVQPGGFFAPDAIAERFWELHAQPRGSFAREIVHRP